MYINVHMYICGLSRLQGHKEPRCRAVVGTVVVILWDSKRRQDEPWNTRRRMEKGMFKTYICIYLHMYIYIDLYSPKYLHNICLYIYVSYTYLYMWYLYSCLKQMNKLYRISEYITNYIQNAVHFDILYTSICLYVFVYHLLGSGPAGNCHWHFEGLFEVHDIRNWDHNVGNESGPYSNYDAVGFASEEARSMQMGLKGVTIS